MPEYPTRAKFHAQRVTRQLLKTCAAQEIGQTGVLLVMAIAACEDAKRYTGPVTYYNDQLIPILGLRKWDTLDRARRMAVDAGWLHYESRGKRKSGVYWSLIPDFCTRLDDNPIDECETLYPTNGDTEYPLNGDKTGIVGGIKRVQCGVQNGDSVGELSYPIPIPVPAGEVSPNPPLGTNGKPKRKRQPFQPPTLSEIQAYVTEKRYHINPVEFQAHYEANGWVQGKSLKPVRNWKMCCVTWEENWKKKNNQSQAVGPSIYKELTPAKNRNEP